MARDYRACIREAFSPLVAACSYAKSAQLTTSDLPKERKADQYRRFNSLKVNKSRAMPIPNGGFVAVLEEGERELVLLCAPSLNSEEIYDLKEKLFGDLRWKSVDFDEATFLVACKELSGFLKIKSAWRQPSHAENFLDIIDNNYKGHSLIDLMDTYHKVIAFEVCVNDPLYRSDPSKIILRVLSYNSYLRSPILSNEVAKAILSLEGKAGCSSFNLVQAVNAGQWRHAFLDIYRCLESLFFFPWVLKIRNMMPEEMSIFEVRDRFRSELKWAAKEKESIGELFLLINSPGMAAIENSSPFFSSLVSDDKANRDAYGRHVYSARNALVHHEDRDQPGSSQNSNEDYDALIRYLCAFLISFDQEYGAYWEQSSINQ